MQIWKWKIEITDRQTIMMPAGAKLLDVQMQCDSMLSDINDKSI